MDSDGIPFLRFYGQGQVAFDASRERLELRLRAGDEHPTLESHLSKYRSLIPSLALLMHLIDGHSGPVRVDSLDTAIRWGDYLESHARRIYASVASPGVAAAKALLRHLWAGKVKDGFAIRDIHRKNWSLLSDRNYAQQAIDMLVDQDWLRPVRRSHDQTGGRGATEYRMHPKLAADAASRRSRESESQGNSTDPVGDEWEAVA